MLKLLIVQLVFILFFSSEFEINHSKALKKIGKDVAFAFIENNFDTILNYIPNHEQLYSHYSNLGLADESSIQDFISIAHMLQLNLQHEFVIARLFADSTGIEWTITKLKKIKLKKFQESNIDYAKIELKMRSNLIRYIISIKCILIEDNWHIIEEINIIVT